MTRTRNRGPRLVPGQPLTEESGRRILMPELLGRVLWFIRHSLDVSQQEVADYTGFPASTVSKLELGSIVAGVHHLDVFAAAFTHFERQDSGPDAHGWEGWEIFRVTTQLSEALADRGYTVLWAMLAEGADDTLYCRGRKLAALVRECWPERRGVAG